MEPYREVVTATRYRPRIGVDEIRSAMLPVFQHGSPNLQCGCFVRFARAGGSVVEPANELLIKHVSHVVEKLNGGESREDRSNFGRVLVPPARRCQVARSDRPR